MTDTPADGGDKPRIYIYHSRPDQPFTFRLARSLTAMGADVVDRAGTSEIMLMVLSDELMDQPQTDILVQAYRSSGRQIIPLRRHPARAPSRLRDMAVVDFLNRDYMTALGALWATLGRFGVALAHPETLDPADRRPPAGDADSPLLTPLMTALFLMAGLMVVILVASLVYARSLDMAEPVREFNAQIASSVARPNPGGNITPAGPPQPTYDCYAVVGRDRLPVYAQPDASLTPLAYLMPGRPVPVVARATDAGGAEWVRVWLFPLAGPLAGWIQAPQVTLLGPCPP